MDVSFPVPGGRADCAASIMPGGAGVERAPLAKT